MSLLIFRIKDQKQNSLKSDTASEKIEKVGPNKKKSNSDVIKIDEIQKPKSKNSANHPLNSSKNPLKNTDIISIDDNSTKSSENEHNNNLKQAKKRKNDTKAIEYSSNWETYLKKVKLNEPNKTLNKPILASPINVFTLHPLPNSYKG